MTLDVFKSKLHDLCKDPDVYRGHEIELLIAEFGGLKALLILPEHEYFAICSMVSPDRTVDLTREWCYSLSKRRSDMAKLIFTLGIRSAKEMSGITYSTSMNHVSRKHPHIIARCKRYIHLK